MKTTFGKGGREDWKGKGRQIDDLLLHDGEGGQKVAGDESSFGAGGRLSSAEGDEAMFVLSIEHKKVTFQLSRMKEDRESGSTTLHRAQDEVEMARMFEEGKITFSKFLEDENLVKDPMLVIKWSEGQYVTRQDGSPLLDALVSWRENTLKTMDTKEGGEEEESEKRHARSKSAPPTQEQINRADSEEIENRTESKQGTLSWVQWWSRNRRQQANTANAVGGRPMLRGAVTAPPSDKIVRFSKPLT